MGKIVAIGGGDFLNRDTKKMDDAIVKRMRNKTLLYFPTPSHDRLSNIKNFKEIFEREYDVTVRPILLTRNNLSISDLREIVLNAGGIYVSGGDTRFFLSKVLEYGLKEIFYEAFQKGIVLSGISCGAIVWFQGCFTDRNSYTYKDTTYNFQMIEGLGFIPLDCAPHFDTLGKESFLDETKKGICLENNSAFMMDDDKYQALTKNGNACYYYEKGKKLVKLTHGLLNDLIGKE